MCEVGKFFTSVFNFLQLDLSNKRSLAIVDTLRQDEHIFCIPSTDIAELPCRRRLNTQNRMDKLSYAWGLAMGQQLKGMGVKNLDYKSFGEAVESGFEGKEPAMPLEEANKLINKYLQNLQADMEKKTRQAGEQFLAENGKKEGVHTTASGLQYVVEAEGNGDRPGPEDEVTVHYTGKLTDGTIFDSSVQRGEPATFPLNRVILGWTEGVQLMKTGAKYTFFVPSDLAYGAQGIPGAIPPHSTLIFDVQLISIKKKSKIII